MGSELRTAKEGAHWKELSREMAGTDLGGSRVYKTDPVQTRDTKLTEDLHLSLFSLSA